VVTEAANYYLGLLYKYWVCEASLHEISEDVFTYKLTDFSEEFRCEYDSFKKIYERFNGDIPDGSDGKSMAAALFMEFLIRMNDESVQAREVALEITYSNPKEFSGVLLEEWKRFCREREEE
jgi:hypothetical protein